MKIIAIKTMTDAATNITRGVINASRMLYEIHTGIAMKNATQKKISGVKYFLSMAPAAKQ